MLGKSLLTILCRRSTAVNQQPAFHVPRRTWAQVGHIVAIPPRIRVSNAEKLLHAIVMVTIWTTPSAFFMSQLKVWRRLYIET